MKTRVAAPSKAPSKRKSKLATKIEELEVARRRIHEMEIDLSFAHLERVSAQEGLLPYVQAVQAFNEWARQQPPGLAATVRAALKQAGLLDIKVGDTPPHEPNWFELLRAG